MKFRINLITATTLVWLILCGTMFGQKAELVVETGHTFLSINAVAFSPDGKIIASSSDDKTIKIRDVQSGLELRTLKGHTNLVECMAFSPDGKTVVSGGLDGTIRFWDITSGREIKNLKSQSTNVTSVVFSPNGKILLSRSNDLLSKDYIQIWSVSNNTQIKIYETNHVDAKQAVNFSPDGKNLVLGTFDGKVRIIDLLSGKEIRVFTGHNYSVREAVFSPDGRLLATTDSVDIRLWDTKNGKELKTIQEEALSITFSPDGKVLASGSDGYIKLWNTFNGQQINSFKAHYGYVRSISFSPNNKFFVSVSDDNTMALWDASSGVELKRFIPHAYDLYHYAISPDGSAILYGNVLWSSNNQKVITEGFPIRFSPDSKIIAGILGKDIGLWGVQTGELIKEIKANFFDLSKITFSSDGKFILANDKIWDIATGTEIQTTDKTFFTEIENYQFSTADKKIRLERAENGLLNILNVVEHKIIARVVVLDRNEWVISTPDGLFDASPDARRLMHYVIGLEPITLEQMKDVYYVPGLLQKIFKGEPLPKVELFEKKDLFPLAEFAPLQSNQKLLTVKLTNRGGGIGQVQVLVNGKEFVRDARPANFDSNQQTARLSINLADAPFLVGKINKIEIVTRNSAGLLNSRGSSRGTEIVQAFDYGAKSEPPNIYAIVGGISDYTGDRLKLNFAAKDAEDFAKAFEVGAVKLFGADKVHIRLLTSNGDKTTVKFSTTDAKTFTATKADFQNAFTNFRKATPNDIFIVYLAGHGVSLNVNQNPNQPGGDTYLYLTQEATTTDKSVLSVENSRKAMAISSDELTELMKGNKALKQVLVLDTCAAGAAANSLVAKRDSPSDQIRAIDRLNDRTGFFVLMGAASDKVSYEASQYGQGLLTYSLLQAMKGARLREGQYADVGTLFSYAQDNVPEMARNIGGIQQPLIIAPNTSGSFDIGKFTQAEQQQIPLSNPKPIFIRPNLRNMVLRFDNLKLTQIMTEQLREMGSIQTRGEPNRIVFVETDEMTDAIQPVGDYTIEGDTLKISVILVKNNALIGKEIIVMGETNNPKKVISQLVEVMGQLLPLQ